MKIELGKIYNISSGGTPSKKCGEYYKDGNIKWVKTGDLKEKYLYDTDECITEKGLQSSSAKLYGPDTVLIAMYGATIGATSILKLEACTNQACAAFCKNDKIMPEYLYYFFKSQKEKFIKDGVGGAQPNISIGYLRNIRINLISIDEQRKIVENLGKIEELICNEQEQIRQYDILIKSRFVEMFGDPISNPRGWEMVNLGDIVTEVRYGTSRPAVEGGKYPYLRMNNLTYDGHLDLTDLKRIDIPDNEVEKCIVRTGDVLFNRTNSIELVGKTCVFDKPEDMIIAGYIIRIRLKPMLLPVVLSYFMNTDSLKKKLRSMAKGAVNQANINAQELQAIEVYIPSLSLQNQFAAFAHQVDKLKSIQQTRLNKTQQLFNSFMQKYFG